MTGRGVRDDDVSQWARTGQEVQALNWTRALARTAAAASAACALAATPAVAWADSPPSSWTDLRTMSCDGAVVATFAPGGVFTSFHVVGSSDVMVPKHVEVVVPGTTQPVTSLDVPGFGKNNRDVTTCQYVDPEGLAVTIIGVRT